MRLLAVAALGVGVGAAAAAADPPLAVLGSGADTLAAVAGPLCLAHGFLDPGRLEVRAGRRRLERGRDFTLDAAAGCLELREPAALHDTTLVVRYAYFPFALRARYVRRDLAVAVPGAPPDSALPALRRVETRAPPPAAGGLRVRGYKTFAFKLGSNRDPALNQSLDLDVSGEIARGVELRALLSDRDLPLQPEGDTESLDELDKVMLEVRTPTLSATLGDYDIQAFGGDFLSYSKRLEGIKAAGSGRERSFVVAAAVAKGRFVSLELAGVEGKQGPYVLTDENGSDLITVVSGSETVWLDGVRMRRGKSQDYTIDYSRGEVTFAPGRLISRDSRITVDFDYTTQAFERNFYVGAARSRLLAGALEVGASIVSETDDSSSPIVSLTDDERQALAAAGDSMRAITAAAGVFVGSGNGDYLTVELGEDAVRYQYAGKNAGDYAVSFTEVGSSAGDYADSTTANGERAYRYVGLQNGSFQPSRTLSAPGAHHLVDLTANYGAGGRLQLDTELAVSGLDLNTLSRLDDGDNTGMANRLRLRLRPLGDAAGSGLELRAGYREVTPTFNALGRIRPADYAYEWNAPADAFARDELLRDLGFDWQLAHGWSLGGDLAATRSAAFRGRRRRLRTLLDRRLRLRFDIERSRGEELAAAAGASAAGGDSTWSGPANRRRALERGEVSSRMGRWTPRLTYEREQRVEAQSGSEFTRYGAGTELALWSRGKLTVGFQRRVDRSLTAGAPWVSTRHADEQSYRLEVPRWRSLSVTGAFTRRATETLATGARQRSDLVQIDMVSSSYGGGIETETHYEVTTTDASDSERELVFVGAGEGAYDAFGRFVGQGGDYELRRASGARGADLRTHLRLNVRSEIRPRHIWRAAAGAGGWRRWLRFTGYETTLFVDELTSLDLVRPRLFFDPASYQRDDATLAGRLRLRQDVDLFEGQRALSARLRYEITDDADNRTAGVFLDRGERRQSLRLRSSPRSALSIEWTGAVGRRFEEQRATAGGGDGGSSGGEGGSSRLDIATQEHRVDLTLRASRALRLGLGLIRRSERDRPTGAELSLLEWSPSLTVSRQRLRVDGRLRRVRERQQGVPPAGAFLGALPGTRTEYSVNTDYRFTRHVSLVGGLGGTGLPGQTFIHTARFELRAYF